MEIHRLFSDRSDLYASARPHYPSEIYKYLARVTPRHNVAWDCACGNGQVAKDLKQYFERVEATDTSTEQLSFAPAIEGVRFSVAAAEATQFENHLFDLICVGQALHWFDYETFWPEVDRVLKPGGVFAAWGYIFPRMNAEVDAVLEETLYPAIAPYWSERNRLLWNHYRDVTIPYHRLDAPTFRMTLDWNVEELLAYIQTWSAVGRCVNAMGDAFYVETGRRMRAMWGEPSQRRTLQMDFCFIASQKD